MAIRNIFKEGDSCLAKVCREVEKFDKRLHILLDDMKETMEKADGVGLAAPQVGILKRIAIIQADDVFLEMINPRILEKAGEQIGVEGCLSVNPQKNCKVARAQRVKIEAYDRHGKKYQADLEDLPARAAQHELDHLNGILFFKREYQGEEGK